MRVVEAEHASESVSTGLNRHDLKIREQINQAVKKATRGALSHLQVAIHENRATERVRKNALISRFSLIRV